MDNYSNTPESPRTYTCADVRRLLVTGKGIDDPAVKTHLSRCAACVAFARKQAGVKKQTDETPKVEEKKPDPQLLAAQFLAMAEREPTGNNKGRNRLIGFIIGIAIVALATMLML